MKTPKIIQLFPADGWVAEHFHPKTFESIKMDQPILFWALTDAGKVCGLIPGTDGLDFAENYENFRYVRKPQSKT